MTDEARQKLAGVLHAYRRLMYDFGIHADEFDIADPLHFEKLLWICSTNPNTPPPEAEIVEDRSGEFYRQFVVYGIKIRCLMTNERRRLEHERIMQKAEQQMKMKMQDLAMSPILPAEARKA